MWVCDVHWVITLGALALASAAHKSYAVQYEDVTVGGYYCGWGEGARVYYPVDSSRRNGQFPTIAFAHGFNAYGSGAYAYYSDMHTALAAAGYIVIASESAAFPIECPSEWRDQIRSLEWLRTSSNLTSMIDQSKTGILGHSMGGGATYHLASLASAIQNYSIGAAVALHPQITSPMPIQPVTNALVPIFFGSGSEDSVVTPASVKSAYSQTTGVAKVFSEISGAVHDEPMNAPYGQRRHTPYVIAMFDCHLKGVKSQCHQIYHNTSGSLCAGKVNMTDCEYVKENSSDTLIV